MEGRCTFSISNAEVGAFRVRLLREGEPYGLHHKLIYRDDTPALEFYPPAAEDEQPGDAHLIASYNAPGWRTPRDEWSWVESYGVSPENSKEIAT